jgi:uncharacterized protein (DUF1684 family)
MSFSLVCLDDIEDLVFGGFDPFSSHFDSFFEALEEDVSLLSHGDFVQTFKEDISIFVNVTIVSEDGVSDGGGFASDLPGPLALVFNDSTVGTITTFDNSGVIFTNRGRVDRFAMRQERISLADLISTRSVVSSDVTHGHTKFRVSFTLGFFRGDFFADFKVLGIEDEITEIDRFASRVINILRDFAEVGFTVLDSFSDNSEVLRNFTNRDRTVTLFNTSGVGFALRIILMRRQITDIRRRNNDRVTSFRLLTKEHGSFRTGLSIEVSVPSFSHENLFGDSDDVVNLNFLGRAHVLEKLDVILSGHESR